MRSNILLNFENNENTDFLVYSIHLKESLSTLYRVELDLVSEENKTMSQLKDSFLGKTVSIKIEQVGDNGAITRYLHGMISKVSHQGSATVHPGWLKTFGDRFPKGILYKFIIEPQLVNLKFAKRNLDYPDTTPLNVIKMVLKRHDIVPEIDPQYIEKEKYQGKVRFIQRNETDFDFIQRILVKYGISFCFRHEEKGPERLYLSDGYKFPALSVIKFTNFPLAIQQKLNELTEEDSYDFSMLERNIDSNLFRMKSFSISSEIGVEYVKNKFLHPTESRDVMVENGNSESTRSWFLSDAPAGYDKNIDEETLVNDLSRSTDATGCALRLQCDEWVGTTDVLLPMPGKILKVSDFYDSKDPPLKVKIKDSDFLLSLADNEDHCEFSFKGMDFDDNALEKRFCAETSIVEQHSHMENIREYSVCDYNGESSNPETLNKIIPSPHSTPEAPWIFMVRNDSVDSENKCMDVIMTMPLGGKRSGMYRFPRVGDRVLVLESADRAVLLGYVPDKTGSFGEFFENADQYSRNATALRYSPPGKDVPVNGRYSEIGFSHYNSAIDAMEQRIIDGTAIAFLDMLALNANDAIIRNDIRKNITPRIVKAKENYFNNPGKDSVKEVSSLAEELVKRFKLNSHSSCNGDVLRLFTEGSIIQYSKKGIDIKTDGVLNINAGAININGATVLNLQSENVVRSVVGPSSITMNANGIALRSLKVLDAITGYDSSIYINAIDGVSVMGANVAMDALFTVKMADALGGSLRVSNGVLQGAAAVFDVATVTRDMMTDAFFTLDERSGLNKINELIECWSSGSTPNGLMKRSIADRGIDAFDQIYGLNKNGLLPMGNYRGSISGVSSSSSDLFSEHSITIHESVSKNAKVFVPVAGANPCLTISTRELMRAKAFAQQLDVQRQTLETVNGTILADMSASVTIHGHQLDLNVKYINDYSEKKNENSSAGAGVN